MQWSNFTGEGKVLLTGLSQQTLSMYILKVVGKNQCYLEVDTKEKHFVKPYWNLREIWPLQGAALWMLRQTKPTRGFLSAIRTANGYANTARASAFWTPKISHSKNKTRPINAFSSFIPQLYGCHCTPLIIQWYQPEPAFSCLLLTWATRRMYD